MMNLRIMPPSKAPRDLLVEAFARVDMRMQLEAACLR
jgi:hypothetical protein